MSQGFLFFLVGCSVVDMQNNEDKTSALQVYPSSISMGKSIHLAFPQEHPKNIVSLQN